MKQGLFILVILAFTSCDLVGERGNDERITKEVSIDSFDKIEVSGAFKVLLEPSQSHKIIIEADENLIRYIDISVRSNRLIIASDRILISRKGVKIKVPVRELSELLSSGASNIKNKEPIVSEELYIEISGAGKIDLKLDVKLVELNLSGATVVYLAGVAKQLDIEMSGAGSLTAGNLEVKDCSVDISGVGHVLVNVSGTLEAQVSGLGKVEYLGDPESVRGDVTGVGDISKADG